jgi:N-acyl amino acid synthase of PEP-CTERM/exosortase system
MLKKINNGVINVVKVIRAKNELNEIGYHFNHHFKLVIAKSENELQGAHSIRHDVFCHELGLFKRQNNGQESDAYDVYSEQCLIQHRSSEEYTSVVRLILPESAGDILPFEQIATKYVTNKALAPNKFARETISEISRIAIAPQYRRRNKDKFAGAPQGAINAEQYCEEELRCFPFIAVGLYFGAAARLINGGKQHAYFMIEPFMARSLKFVGVPITCIGDEFEYVGKRRPYYIDVESFVNGIKPSLKHMFEEFLREDQLNRSLK